MLPTQSLQYWMKRREEEPSHATGGLHADPVMLRSSGLICPRWYLPKPIQHKLQSVERHFKFLLALQTVSGGCNSPSLSRHHGNRSERRSPQCSSRLHSRTCNRNLVIDPNVSLLPESQGTGGRYMTAFLSDVSKNVAMVKKLGRSRIFVLKHLKPYSHGNIITWGVGTSSNL